MVRKGKDSPYFKDRVGEKHITNEGYEIEIIEYFNSANCTIRFISGLILYKITYNNFKKGNICNPYHRSMRNIGFFGVGEYSCYDNNNNNKITKGYNTWNCMFKRCYSSYYSEINLTYKDVIVCEEWHNFQNFAKWFEENYNPEYMEGWHLDKDILIKGNKAYSPETCCFVPREINILFTKNNKNRGDYPIGVSKANKKFIGIFKHKHLGTFATPEEAFQAYKTAKETDIKEVADKWEDKISKKVYKALYNYQVEITD